VSRAEPSPPLSPLPSTQRSTELDPIAALPALFLNHRVALRYIFEQTAKLFQYTKAIYLLYIMESTAYNVKHAHFPLKHLVMLPVTLISVYLSASEFEFRANTS